MLQLQRILASLAVPLTLATTKDLDQEEHRNDQDKSDEADQYDFKQQVHVWFVRHVRFVLTLPPTFVIGLEA